MRPKSIEQELENLEAAKRDVLALSDVATVAHEVADLFSEMNIVVSIVKRTAQKPFINLRPADVDSFKDALPVLRELAKRGWHTHKACPFTDCHELDRREYNLCEKGEFPEVIDPVTGEVAQKDDWNFQYRLRLMLFLAKDATNCRKVQVGTKQEPVYEFVCE